MAATPSLPKVEAARFQVQGPSGPEGAPVAVLFNPASLDYSVSNQMKDQPGGDRRQFVEKSKATLKMQLVFDTTDSGEDVRMFTGPVLRLLQPRQTDGSPVPPTVSFEWGAFAFTGMVDQFKEVMDFFAAEGVPLRSTVDLSLTDQDFQFQESDLGRSDTSGGGGPEPVVLPDAAGGPAELADRLGAPGAARTIASANGAVSLRGAVGGDVAIGAGAGFDLEAGFGAGAAASFGLGPGDAASSFNGLRLKPPPPPKLPASGLAAATSLGGGASASLKAEVGADADLNQLISFG